MVTKQTTSEVKQEKTMDGILMLVVFGIVALIVGALRESQDIVDNSPQAPPTKDAYDA